MRQIILIKNISTLPLLFFCISLFFPPLFAELEAAEIKYGAFPGEKLKFNVHWMGIPAGRAEMNVLPKDPGKYELEAVVETIGMVKFLHAITDTLQSRGNLLDNKIFQTVSYFKDQRKGSNIRQIDYKFDREKKIVMRLRKEEEPIPIEISSKQVNDPLAVFYTLRALPNLKPGDSLLWLTVDGRKEYKMAIDVGQPVQKFTPLGRFKILPVKVRIPSSGELFRQEEAIEIWLTDDHRRMPVRVETRLSLGGVAADLVEYYDGRGEHGELAGAK